MLACSAFIVIDFIVYLGSSKHLLCIFILNTSYTTVYLRSSYDKMCLMKLGPGVYFFVTYLLFAFII